MLKQKRGLLLAASFLLLYNFMVSQPPKFIDNLNLKGTYVVKNFTKNPYKLMTESFFEKALTGEIIYGTSKATDNYEFNCLDVSSNTITKKKLDLSVLKTKLSKKEYDDLIFYGFSNITKNNTYTILSIGDNHFHLFQDSLNQLLYKKTVAAPEALDFNYIFCISDTALVLLDYRATFEGVSHIRSYIYNLTAGTTSLNFDTIMGSNSASYDRTNTRYYDYTKNYFLIGDNLDYKIYLFDNTGKKITSYYKELEITDQTRLKLNPVKLTAEYPHDSVSKYLHLTPKVHNIQFLNDTDIIVNYSNKPSKVIDGSPYRNSTIDLLTVRGNKIVYKKTMSDEYIYETVHFKTTGKISERTINPYTRMSLYSFYQKNNLINFTFEQMIPRSNTSFEKYTRKAKLAILGLKSNFIYSIYAFTN